MHRRLQLHKHITSGYTAQSAACHMITAQIINTIVSSLFFIVHRTNSWLTLTLTQNIALSAMSLILKRGHCTVPIRQLNRGPACV